MKKNKDGDCNCKARKDINNMISTIDKLNLSTSKNHISPGNTVFSVLIIIFKFLFYIIGILLFVIFIIPIILTIVIFRKHITIKLPFNNKK